MEVMYQVIKDLTTIRRDIENVLNKDAHLQPEFVDQEVTTDLVKYIWSQSYILFKQCFPLLDLDADYDSDVHMVIEKSTSFEDFKIKAEEFYNRINKNS